MSDFLNIQYCSDLHLEFEENTKYIKGNPIEAKGDYLILAGDIVPLKILDKFNWFFEDIALKFKHIYWIPGNHEYYNFDIHSYPSSFQKKISNNVTLLNNQCITLNNTNLIFSTLWTNIALQYSYEISESKLRRNI